MKNITLFVFCSVLFFACNPSNEDSGKIKNDFFESILGKWKRDGEPLYEKWENKDGQYQAVVHKITASGESILKETVYIIEENENFYFRVIVEDQNEGRPIKFKLISAETNKLVFEDKDHDYPQRITYEKIADNKLVATISGLLNGVEKAIPFNYSKVKE